MTDKQANLLEQWPTRTDLVRQILDAWPHLTIVEIHTTVIACQYKLTIEDVRHALRELQECGQVRQTPPDDVHRAWRYYLSKHAASLSQDSTTPSLHNPATQQPTGTLAS